ncbi:MAG: autotransporter-associated beta strand repeat-containing protein, partial [Planctomycetales bacterium]|nr:autotransporter-associated beta strand repeat-containing protein [Planctomycetales bacterium]
MNVSSWLWSWLDAPPPQPSTDLFDHSAKLSLRKLEDRQVLSVSAMFSGGGVLDLLIDNSMLGDSGHVDDSTNDVNLSIDGSGHVVVNGIHHIYVDDGMGGTTELLASAVTGITVTDTIGVDNVIDLSNVTLTNFASLSGTIIVDAGDGADVITGSEFNDALSGGAGIDSLSGGLGADTLNGGLGDDLLDGGAGDDIYQFTATFGTDTVSDASGNDTLDLSTLTVNVSCDLSSSATMTSSAGSVSFTLSQMEFITTGSGDDTFNINESSTIDVHAGTGNDSFVFANGFSAGDLFGDGGTDTLNYSAYSTSVTVNLLTGAAGTGAASFAGFENITGGSAADTLTGDGSDNVFTGGGGLDILRGGLGNDTLINGYDSDGQGGTDIITISSALTTSNGTGITLTAETINLNANLSTDGGTNAGAVLLNGAVVLSANVTIDSDHASGTDGAITVTGSMNADAAANARSLTLTAGGGAIDLSGAPVGVTQALQSFSASSTASTLSYYNSIRTRDGGITISGVGSPAIRLYGDLSTDAGTNAGNIAITGSIQLNANVSIDTNHATAADGNFSVSGAVNADAVANNRTLSVDAGTGTVSFASAIGGSKELQSFTVVGASTASLSSVATRSGGISVTAGTITLNGNITTNVLSTAGAVSLSGAVSLGANVTVNSDSTTTDANISITGAVNGARNLTLTAGTGTVTLGSTVGQTTALTDLDITGSTINLAGNIQADGGTLTFAGNTVITAASGITIDTETGNNSAAGSVTFSGGSISGSAAGKDLTINTATGGANNAGNVTLAGVGNTIRNVSVTGTTGAGTNATITLGGTANVTGTVDLTGQQITTTAGLTTDGNVTLVANAMSIGAAINAGANSVALRQLTSGNQIDLGATDSGGVLGLTDAELDFITAGTINLGDANTGGITISDAITLTTATNLSLTTKDDTNITFGTSGSLDATGVNVTLTTGGTGAIVSGDATTDIKAATLTLNAGSGGIGVSGNALTFDATTLTAIVGGNGASYLSELNTVDVVNLSNHLGSVNLISGTFRISPGGGVNGFSPVFIDSAAVLQLNGNELYLNSLSGSGQITNDSATAGILHVANITSSTFSGVLGGADADDNNFSVTTEWGTGTFTLSGTNTYTGTTTVNSGGLTLSGGSAIIDTGAVVLANVAGVVLTLSSNETIGSLSGGGTTGGNVALGNKTLTTGDATNTAFAGVVGGTGSLVKQGSGTFTLSGTNTFDGGTTISDGVLSISSDANLGTAPGSAATKITLNGGTLQATANVTLNANRSISLTGAGTLSSRDAGETLTVGGTVNGNQALTVSGAGNITFAGVVGAGAALASLTQNVGSGLVTFENNVTVGAGGATFNESVTLDGMTLESGGVVTFGTASTDTLTISGAATVIQTTDGAIVLNSTTTATQNVTLRTGTTSGTGGIDVNAKLTGSGTILLDAADSITVDAAIDPITVTLEADDDITISAAVVATDLITVLAGQDGSGSIIVANTGSLAVDNVGNTADITMTTGVTSGDVTLDGTTTADDTVTITTAGAINGAGLVTAATIDLNAATGIGNTTALELAGSIITADNNTSGNVDIDNALASAVTVTTLTTAGGGTILFEQFGGGAVSFGTVSTTADGTPTAGEDNITLRNTGGNLTVTTSVTANGQGNILLTTTTSGNVILTGTTTAAGDTVTINSVGNINGAGLVTAATIDLNAI